MARPKEFDPDEAVDRAIDYFSRHTYRATTVRGIARHIGNSSSFYNTLATSTTHICWPSPATWNGCRPIRASSTPKPRHPSTASDPTRRA